MFQHDYLGTCCFECLIVMCFVFLYLHLFSTIEHVSHGKALWKYAHYYYYDYYYCFFVCVFFFFFFFFVFSQITALVFFGYEILDRICSAVCFPRNKLVEICPEP